MLVPEHNTAPDGVTPVRLQHTHAAVPVSRWAGVSNSALTQFVRDVLVLIICSNARHGHGHQPLSHSCHVCIGPACSTPAFLFGLRPHDGVIQLISWVLWPASAHIKLLGMRAHPAMLGWPGLTDPGLIRKQYFLSLFASFSIRLHAHACASQLSRRQAYEAPIMLLRGPGAEGCCTYAKVLSTGSDTIGARSLVPCMLSCTAGQARSSVSAGVAQSVLRDDRGTQAEQPAWVTGQSDLLTA